MSRIASGGSARVSVRRHVLTVAVLLLGVAALYAPILDDEWHFDDRAELAWSGVSELRPSVRAENYRGILTLYSWALNYRISGTDPWSYHVFNGSVHALNAILVYVVCWQLLGWVVRTPPGERWFPSLFAAAIFATHPIATQTVAYVTQRSTSLAALAVLATLAMYLAARRPGGLIRWPAFVACVVLFAVGLHTKHLALMVPAVLIVTEILGPDARRPRAWAAVAPFAALAAARAAQLVPRRLPGVEPLARTFVVVRDGPTPSPPEYALTQFDVVVRYLRLLVAPVGQSLVHDVRSVTGVMDPRVLGGIGVLAVIAVSGWRVRRVAPVVTWGIAVFFLTLAPTSSVIPSPDWMWEHRVYLPLAAFSIAVAGGFAIVASKYGWGRVPRYVVGAVVVGTLAILTAGRLPVWDDEASLWADAVAHAPRSAVAWMNHGRALQAGGKLREAERSYREALAIQPEQVFAMNNLGNVLRALGRSEDAEALFLRALEIEPTYEDCMLNLGNLSFDRGDIGNARVRYARIDPMGPLAAAASFNLAQCDERDGDWAAAIESYRAAVEHDSSATVRNALGCAYLNAGQLDAAEAELRRAAADSTTWAIPPFNLGALHEARGQRAEAARAYRSALKLDGTLVVARDRLRALGQPSP